MLEQSKIVKILDFDTEKYFKIIPIDFDDFWGAFDLFINGIQSFFISKDGMKFKSMDYLPILLKCVLPMDTNGKEVVWQMGKPFTYNDAKGMFENPAALLELAYEVAKFQHIFFKQYPRYLNLMNTLQENFNTLNLGLEKN